MKITAGAHLVHDRSAFDERIGTASMFTLVVNLPFEIYGYKQIPVHFPNQLDWLDSPLPVIKVLSGGEAYALLEEPTFSNVINVLGIDSGPRHFKLGDELIIVSGNIELYCEENSPQQSSGDFQSELRVIPEKISIIV